MPSSPRQVPRSNASGSAATLRWEQLSDGRPTAPTESGAIAGGDSAAFDASAAATAAVYDWGSEAFTALVDRWTRPLFRFHWNHCQDVQQTEDWLQETFKRAWERRAALRDPAAVRGWLFGIAAMLHREHYRRSSIERRHLGRPVDLAVAIEDEPMVAGWDSRVQRALAMLSIEDRRLVVLIGAHDLNQRDVAAMQGLTESVVQKRWQRAAARLAANLITVDTPAPTGPDLGSGFRDKESGR